MESIDKIDLINKISELKKDGRQVIIFGAGAVGEALFYACKKNSIYVDFFCDNNANKAGKLLCNVNIIHTEEVFKKYKDAVILISAADIHDVIKQLEANSVINWFPGISFLKDFDVYEFNYTKPSDFVEYAVNTGILCQNGYLEPDKIFIRSVDVVITEKCSLKCKDCSNLMQYYDKPQNYITNDVINSIDNFCHFVDEINEFRVIGGEPFMNKEFHIITKKLIEEPKVKRIVIYTNGTIIPNKPQIEHIKDSKVLVLITNYGNLSRNLNNLVQTLSENGIQYYVQKAGGWTDCAIISKHDRNVAKQKEIFDSCCAKNTFTIANGKFYRCPFSANLDNLKAVSRIKNDFIDLSELYMLKNLQEVKSHIRDFIIHKEFLGVCDYCNGRAFDAPEITPAIQTKKPLEYKFIK